MTALSDSGLRKVFDQALDYLHRLLPARSLAFLYGPEDRVRAVRGEPSLSSSLLDRVRSSGAPVLSADVSEDPVLRESTSLLLAGIQSVLCVPLKDSEQRVCGFIYAEHDGQKGCFTQTDLLRVNNFARDLERRLAGGGNPWQAPVAVPVARAPRPSARTAPALPAPVGAARSRPLSDRSQVLLLRSLHNMLAAGVPLSRGLSVLGAQGASEAEREVAAMTLRQVEQGQPLSVALQRSSPSFTQFQLRLLKVGETSGALVEVLDTLAAYEERRRAFSLRLRSSLAYPAVLFCICCLVLLLGPPLMMSGLRGLFAQLGDEMPASARLMLEVGALLSSPWTLLGAVVLVGLALTSLRLALRQPAGRRALRGLGARLPVVAVLLQRLAVVRFCEALALQLRVGLSVLEAVEQALLASADPLLQESSAPVLRELREGSDLASALEAANFFPRTMLQLLAAGEESGKVAEILAWVARIQRLELETSLDTLLAAAEPAMLLSLGIVACFVAWVVLEPMVTVVGRL